MKIGFIVTTNCGPLRPNGKHLINRFIHTLKDSMFFSDYIIYLYDNESEYDLTLNFNKCKHLKLDYNYIEDQKKGGLTKTWNDGCNKALNDGCDIIIVCNDDIVFNNSIYELISTIAFHKDRYNAVYGPVTNGVLSPYQHRDKPGNDIINFTTQDGHVLNGFCFGFNREFIQYSDSTKREYAFDCNTIFDPEIKWGGNEEEFMNRVKEKGGKLYIVEKCWIHHDKIRGWKQLDKK